MGYAMDGFPALDLTLFALGTFAAAFVTGLAGFAFGIVAAAVWLHFLAPAQAAALIVAFGLIVQGVSVWKLRRAIKWRKRCSSSYPHARRSSSLRIPWSASRSSSLS